MLQTVEAMIEPDGSIRLLEKLHVTKSTKALLTLLEAPANEDTLPASGAAILEFLKNSPLKSENCRSVEEIHHALEQERQAWD